MGDFICQIKQGTLQGQPEANIYGDSFISFMGIPYAKPPLGNLRFKSPQPPESWEGIRDATKQGNPCHALQLLPTPETLVLKPAGSEDCLFLNVYTRQLPRSDQNLKPVMMFIHGGAFISGSSDRYMYGPEFLMIEDIVLVTINYRLGALGFLVIDDPSLEVTGNAGLKDQVQALRWINKNIRWFGGDPSNVTIFGESAGGASVHYLMMSPLAKGLFHKAIVQSASVLCPFAHGVNDAQKLAKIIGYNESDDDKSKILEFLQQVSVEELIEGQIKLGDWLSPVKKRNVGPSVEPKLKDAFISDSPLNIIKSGNYNHVPLMIGYTSLEGIFEEGSKLLGFQQNLEEFVPYYLGFSKDSDAFKSINKKILNFYYNSDKADSENTTALYTVITDSVFLRGIHEAVKAHAKTTKHPIYYYRMSVDTSLNMFKNMLNFKAEGVSHGDDLGYLFKIGSAVFEPRTVEETAVLRFVKMWTNFARTGNPIPMKDSLLNVNWKPVTEKELNFLDIGTELVAGTDPDIERMNFWDQICDGIEENY